MNPEVSPMLQPAANEPACLPLGSAGPLLFTPPPLTALPWTTSLLRGLPDGPGHTASSLENPPLEPLEPLAACKRELDAVLASLGS